MPKVAARRMTAEEFDEVLPFLTISDERCAAARAVLVDGESLAEVARMYVCSRQFVDKTVTIVCNTVPLAAYFKASQTKLLAGWERHTINVPPELLNKFRLEIAEAVAAERLKAQEKKARNRK